MRTVTTNTIAQFWLFSELQHYVFCRICDMKPSSMDKHGWGINAITTLRSELGSIDCNIILKTDINGQGHVGSQSDLFHVWLLHKMSIVWLWGSEFGQVWTSFLTLSILNGGDIISVLHLILKPIKRLSFL